METLTQINGLKILINNEPLSNFGKSLSIVDDGGSPVVVDSWYGMGLTMQNSKFGKHTATFKLNFDNPANPILLSISNTTLKATQTQKGLPTNTLTIIDTGNGYVKQQTFRIIFAYNTPIEPERFDEAGNGNINNIGFTTWKLDLILDHNNTQPIQKI